MYTIKLSLSGLLFIFIGGLFYSCSDDDDQLPPFTVSFSTDELSISPTISEVQITLNFSRPATVDGNINLRLQPGSLSYGESADFYTSVAPVNDIINLPFTSQDQRVSLTIFAGTAFILEEEKTLTIDLMQDAGNSFVPGVTDQLNVVFAENFISRGARLEIDGGGSSQPYQVFVDLSKQTQEQVDKYSWDLGFSTDPDEFAVVLNSSAFVMARPLDITDIDAVTPDDTIGFSSQMYISNYNDPEAAQWIDNQNGNLNETAVDAVSTTDLENRVYIIKRDGENRNWKKIRILRNGNGYKLQYANIAASTHQELNISKDEAYNFAHVDLDNGPTFVEPEKDKWDLMYSTYSVIANFGAFLAIAYNDIVILNRTGVGAIKIEETSELTYDNFSSTDLENHVLEDNNIFVVGDTWRALENFTLVLEPDIFYVINDPEGNHYKIKFTRLASEDGERGYPTFTYELL